MSHLSLSYENSCCGRKPSSALCLESSSHYTSFLDGDREGKDVVLELNISSPAAVNRPVAPAYSVNVLRTA